MHGPSLAILMVVASLGMPAMLTAGTAEAVAEARRKLDRNDGVGAVAILEEALPGATSGKETLLELLGKAYEVAAKQSLDAGRPRDAETYAENLKILSRSSRPARGTIPPARPKVEPAESPLLLPETPAAPTPLPEGPPPSVEVPNVQAPSPAAAEAPVAEPVRPVPVAEPATLLPIPVEGPPSDLPAADSAFAAKDYAEAGRIYSILAKEGRLPAGRREHWIYCRCFGVVARINARPGTDAEWASIDAEVEQIRALNPDNWLGEYVRNLASARKKTKPMKAVVVRGQAPEEPPAARQPARPAPSPAPANPAPQAVKLASNGAGPAARVGPPVGRWQIRESANFRIYHVDPVLAAMVAQAAEHIRVEQTKRWSGQAPRAPWQPICEIYLYPTAAQYAQMTGQPEDSPGFSTMGMNAGRIISRRVNLRADHPTLVEAVLPHEITHVILADFFTNQQIPRWADEGLAVLSEPVDEQQRRAADLVSPLASNRLFPVDALMSMDYPDNRYWGLYYAQSVSLTRFLTEQGTPGQMIQFLQVSQREGYEEGLRRVYKIDGYPDLQRRWLTFARTRGDTRTATAPATGPDLKVR